jgi:hypothetical protein
VSTFFIGNPRVTNGDCLIIFMLRSRSDALWTPLRKAMIFKEEWPSTNITSETKRF